MSRTQYIALHTIGAATFIFVLNYLILGTQLESAVLWAIGFGGMAFAIARSHKRAE